MIDKQLTVFSRQWLKFISYIGRGIFKDRNDIIGRDKLTISQFLLLDLVDTRGRRKMKDIADEFDVSLPAATGLIKRLVVMRMVRREYDACDRRLVYIRLTACGRKTLNVARAQRRRAVERLFSRLTRKERDDYLRIMKKLARLSGLSHDET